MLLWSLKFFSYYLLFSVCWCTRMWMSRCTRGIRGKFVGVGSLLPVDPRDGTQVTRLSHRAVRSFLGIGCSGLMLWGNLMVSVSLVSKPPVLEPQSCHSPATFRSHVLNLPVLSNFRLPKHICGGEPSKSFKHKLCHCKLMLKLREYIFHWQKF